MPTYFGCPMFVEMGFHYLFQTPAHTVQGLRAALIHGGSETQPVPAPRTPSLGCTLLLGPAITSVCQAEGGWDVHQREAASENSHWQLTGQNIITAREAEKCSFGSQTIWPAQAREVIYFKCHEMKGEQILEDKLQHRPHLGSNVLVWVAKCPSSFRFPTFASFELQRGLWFWCHWLGVCWE